MYLLFSGCNSVLQISACILWALKQNHHLVSLAWDFLVLSQFQTSKSIMSVQHPIISFQAILKSIPNTRDFYRCPSDRYLSFFMSNVLLKQILEIRQFQIEDLKVSKFRKQIVIFSFEPKTERNISALRIDPQGRNISFSFWFK